MNCIYIIFYFIFIKILFLYTKRNNSFRIKIWNLISLLSDSIYLNRNLWNGLINRKIIPIFPLRLISCLICYRQPYRIVPAIFLEANFAYIGTLPCIFHTTKSGEKFFSFTVTVAFLEKL